MTKSQQILILSLFLLMGKSISVIGQQYSFDWARVPHNNTYESGNSVVVDSINHFVYLAGVMQKTLPDYPDIQSDMMNGGTDNGNKDGFVAKYDFGGNVIWAFNIGGANDDEITGITIDLNGNIYITGYYEGPISLNGHTSGVSGNVSAAFGGKDIFIAAYDSNGALLSYSVFGGLDDDAGIDICTNSTSIFLTGFYTGSANFIGAPTNIPYNNINIFIAAIDFSNNFLWLTDAGSTGNDFDTSLTYQERNMGIAADDSAVYIIGVLEGNYFLVYNADGSLADTLYNNDSAENIFVLSYDPSGMHNWGQTIENTSNPVNGMDIATDSFGIYITGTIRDQAMFPSGNIFSSSNSDIFLARLDKTTGIDTWIEKTTGSTSNGDIDYGISSDDHGSIYVTGTYSSDPLSFGSDTSLNVDDAKEVFLAKYNNSGNFQWAISAHGWYNDIGLNISTFKDSAVFICGITSENITFSGNYFSTSSYNNVFLAKLSTTPKNGFGFDESGCTGDTDNNGYITYVNGSTNLEVNPCEHVEICETIFVADGTGNGWLDSLTFDLGVGYTNISNMSPNGLNNGFYESGNWSAQYNSSAHTIIWAFQNSNFTHPDYGDGYTYNSTYSCVQGTPHEYHFCFEADIASTANTNDLTITMTVADDGYSLGSPGPIVHDTATVNEINLIDLPPVFTSCSNDTTIYTTSSTCSLPFSWDTPIATDECNASVNQIAGPSSGSNFSLCTTEISYVATDNAGNTDTCSFSVTVTDSIHPLITCPAYQTVSAPAGGGCDYTVSGTEFDPSYSDNCTVSPAVNSFNGNNTLAGATLSFGNNLITWIVTDGAGNSSSCNFIVTVADTVPPDINCPDNQTVYTTAANCGYTVQGAEFDATASDNCGLDSISNDFNSGTTLAGEYLPVGTDTIAWQAADNSGNINTCSFNINVMDTFPPDIVCPGNQYRYPSNNCSYFALNNEFDPLSVNDNCSFLYYNDINSGTTLNGEEFLQGTTYQVTWTVEDDNNNISTCSFTILIEDTIPPNIVCHGNLNIFSDSSNCAYSIQGQEFDPVSVTDNCYVYSLVNTFNGDTSLAGETLPVGQTTVTWTVTDQWGNMVTCTDTITVYDTISPHIDGLQDIITCDSIVYWQPPSATDNCSNVTVTQTGNPQYQPGSVFPTGTTVIEYTASDSSGNSQAVHFSVTVLPALHPYWTGLPATFCINDNTFNLDNLVAGDTGGVWLVDSSPKPAFTPADEGAGIHTVTYHLDNGYCSADSSIMTEILNIPSVNAGTNTEICGLSAQLNGTVSSGTFYWSVLLNNLTFSPDTNTLNPEITASDYGSYQITLTAYENSTCSNSDTVTIGFYQMPQTVDAGQDQILNITNETQLNALLPDIGNGEWSVLQGSGDFVSINNPATMVTNLQAMENIFIWTVVNGPCRDSDIVSITVHNLKIPDAFSPNGDGINDNFIITGIEDHQSELIIFNRWGKEVFRAINYQNNWNGKTKDGKDLPEDTYFYILTIDGENHHGSITLSR